MTFLEPIRQRTEVEEQTTTAKSEDTGTSRDTAPDICLSGAKAAGYHKLIRTLN